MDFLQQAFAQSSKFVQSMTPGARIMAAASLAFVVLGAAWLSNRRDDGPGTYLMGRQSFSATQLRDMEGAFGKAGLANYQIEGDRVRVPRGQQSKYMAALADAGAMPEDFGEYLREAVNSGGFMVSRSRQDAQAKIALQSELQLVIRRMKGIKNAFVHIAEETSRGLQQTKTVTASVGIEPSDAAAVDDATIAAIRSFVASAWAGLKPEAVTVVSTNHASGPAPIEPATGDPVLRWLGENWQSVGIGGLMLAGLLLAWSTVRSVSATAAPETLPAVSLPESLHLANEVSLDRAVGRAAIGVCQPSATSIGALREELGVMIRQDPQAAASVLRTWIGNAS
jgi:flagellar biosynthesis/type III secretory pathway M-ring protein FliF/YscJ